MAKVSSRDNIFPSGSIVVRFGVRTPYWPLSTSFGMFEDASLRRIFVSVDHYVGFMMLRDPSHRQAVYETPNAFVANVQLRQIISAYPGAVDPAWEERREDIVRYGVNLKFEQNLTSQRMLIRTGDRPIYDDSRDEDSFMCYARGEGANFHGKLLEDIRSELLNARSQLTKPVDPRTRAEESGDSRAHVEVSGPLPEGTQLDWGDRGAKLSAEMDAISRPPGQTP